MIDRTVEMDRTAGLVRIVRINIVDGDNLVAGHVTLFDNSMHD